MAPMLLVRSRSDGRLHAPPAQTAPVPSAVSPSRLAIALSWHRMLRNTTSPLEITRQAACEAPWAGFIHRSQR